MTVNGVKMRAKYCSICGVFRRCAPPTAENGPLRRKVGPLRVGRHRRRPSQLRPFVAFVGTTTALAFYVATSSLFH